MSERIKITLREGSGGSSYELMHDKKNTLLETMREGAVMLPSLCGGVGKCGKCVVRFVSHAPLPTQTDRSLIPPERLREGCRLACMARPKRECSVVTDFAEEKRAEEGRCQVVTECRAKEGEERISQGKETEEEQGSRGEENTDDKYAADGNFGTEETLIAADIGTTTVAMQLLDIGTGRPIDTYTCLNPQRSYGADVISRIKAAEGDGGKKLQTLIWDTLAAGRERLENSAAGHGGGKPRLMVIACNTAMGHILLDYPTETLGKSPFRPVDIKTSFFSWNGMEVAVMPGISAFVGGDILAGLFACGLCGPVFGGSGKTGYEGLRPACEPCRPDSGRGGQEENGPETPAWLFMDLGTNAEMVMGTGCRVAATAAAAGPAFEGRGKDGSLGSERISALADLLEKGIADGTGLLAEPYFATGIETEIGDGTRRVMIRQEDIRDIQMAKAAVRAGIHFLMKRLEIKDAGRIKKIYIAGGMGFYLDIKAAVRTGLLPEGLGGNPEAVGNTALAGAGLFGRKGGGRRVGAKDGTNHMGNGEQKRRNRQEAAQELEAFAQRAEFFNMAELETFEEVYVGYMDFDCKEIEGML